MYANVKQHKNNEMIFQNTTESNLSISDVLNSVINHIQEDPTCSYVLTVGTDSQVKRETHFISVVHLHRISQGIGRGAWGWRTEYIEPRKVTSLREKIMTECNLTQQLIYELFELNFYEKISDIIIPYMDEGANFTFKPHVDIGTDGETKMFIREVTKMFKGMGLDVEIKPNSYAASSYANKYTK